MPELADRSCFDDKRLVVFDIDGTLALGRRALPGAVELIESLRASGIRVAFISNDSGFTKQVKAERLRAAGIPVHDEEREFFTPLDSILAYLAECACQRAYLAATPEVEAWFARHGVAHQERAPERVVLCRDTTLDYAKLSYITQLIYRGVPYIASNPDSFYPTAEGPAVDLAGLIELIAITTGGARPLRIFGKPDISMLEATARPHDIAPANMLMVGDRLHTDIRMAQEFGCDSVVVLTGDTTRDKLLTARDVRPTHVVEGVHVLAEQLVSRRPRAAAQAAPMDGEAHEP